MYEYVYVVLIIRMLLIRCVLHYQHKHAVAQIVSILSLG